MTIVMQELSSAKLSKTHMICKRYSSNISKAAVVGTERFIFKLTIFRKVNTMSTLSSIGMKTLKKLTSVSLATVHLNHFSSEMRIHCTKRKNTWLKFTRISRNNIKLSRALPYLTMLIKELQVSRSTKLSKMKGMDSFTSKIEKKMQLSKKKFNTTISKVCK